jgi:thiamine-monophosphate kinase
MNNSEFDVIKKYFSFSSSRDDVVISSGDDCAAVSVPAGKKLIITTDTLISGVHFPVATSPDDIAFKSLMVNLSDLAAMGATPAWLTLAITLPDVDDRWLSAFSQQFSSVLTEFNISLIGGDTTRGALSITIQAMGFCAQEKLLRRDKAKAGDKIFVTGDIGDAAIGLRAVLDRIDDEELLTCVDRLNRPEVRIRFAEVLSRYSRCAIDISDGLAADLGHILSASNCGADIKLSDIPLSSAARYYFDHYHKSQIDWSMVLTQGDDYELCFTVDSEDELAVKRLAEKYQLKISCIGNITDSKKLKFFTDENELISFPSTGFKHF